METVNTKQDDNEDDNKQEGALVLWKYNNPFSNYKQDPAYILSKYVADHLNLDYLSGISRRRKIRFIELGSGCGLVGLVAWLTGGYVVCTGTHEDIEHTKFNIKQNVEYVMNQLQNQFECNKEDEDNVVESRNKIAHTQKMMQNLDLLDKDNIQAHVLDWTSLPTTEDTTNPLHKSNMPSFDIILASEILYLPDLHKDLVKTIRYFNHSNSRNDQDTCFEKEIKSKDEMKCETRVLGIYKQRGLGEEQFFKIAQAFGKLRVEWIDTSWIDQPSIGSHVNQFSSTTSSEYKMFWLIPDS
ncbi:hypothetical protein C2G38_2146341 [Gigaspora rosea]|uniref:Methyltransferase-domain-containing protein n=1 Tax=Gigaspora rosea TaxID=44941 RepID=A0A397UI20_9GLOM|nr:hypothetical protein C2G38_2146341 [Gigaspora rosea]